MYKFNIGNRVSHGGMRGTVVGRDCFNKVWYVVQFDYGEFNFLDGEFFNHLHCLPCPEEAIKSIPLLDPAVA